MNRTPLKRISCFLFATVFVFQMLLWIGNTSAEAYETTKVADERSFEQTETYLNLSFDKGSYSEDPLSAVYSESVPPDADSEEIVSETDAADEEAKNEPEEESSANVNPPYTILELIHDGIAEKKNDKAIIDYSHVEDGYFMFQRIHETSHRYKVLVKGGGKTYQYNIDTGDWYAFPISEGDGNYSVQIMENVSGTKYANVLSVSFKAKLLDPFSPFLRPNLNVNYVDAPDTMEKGAELTEGCEGPLSKVDAVYEFVIGNISYDHILAATVQTSYMPDLDRVLKRKRGICYDYASLMTAMLRSQNVPTKLVFGYVGKLYHAWISVWVDEVGWVETIYFDGKSWQRMDPTFAAAGTSDEAIKKYVGNGKNYSVKFCF